MKKRNTIQKQIIIDCLKNTKSHPNINQLYEMVNKKDNSIGKSTIYRNINSMVEDGTVKTILTSDNTTRYDGDVSNHIHFICNNCGKIIDIYSTDTVDKSLEKKYKLNIYNKKVIYEGLCENCLNEKDI